MTPSLLFLNTRGQALVETLLSLPTLIAGVILVLGGLHSLFAFFWVDHWSYDLSDCLIKERATPLCVQNFKRRTELLPFARIEILQSSRWSNHVVVQTQLRTALMPNKIFSIERNGQLTSRDFAESL